MKDKIKFGIIGCGAIANVHARAIKSAGGVLCAVYDKSFERAEEFARRFEIEATDSLKSLYDAVDVVNICTPSGLHAQYTVGALESGCHVMVEKPIALTVDDCNKIIESTEKHQKLCSVISQLRFSENVKKVRKAVKEGLLGKITSCNLSMFYHRSEEYYAASSWRGTWFMDGGGAVMNQGIHGVDLLLYIMGDVCRVASFCKTLKHDIDVEDTAVAVLEFKSGAVGTVEATTSVYPGYPRSLKICGTEGSIEMVEDAIVCWDVPNADFDVDCSDCEVKSGFSNPMDITDSGHIMQIEEMIDAVQNGTPLINTPYEARRIVELICKMYESSESGKMTCISR